MASNMNVDLETLLQDGNFSMEKLLETIRDRQSDDINKGRIVFGEYHHLFPLLKKNERKFKEYTRMTLDCFQHILSHIERECVRNWCNLHTRPIMPEERLVVTLRLLITGASYRTLSFSFRMGVSTISNIVKEMCQAIWKTMHPIHMPIPTKEKLLQITQKFATKNKFPHCLGALDAKHIRIKCPPNSGSEYFNYKKFYSVVLQAVVSADGEFITIDVGGRGRQHDSATFKASTLYKALTTKKLQILEPAALPGTDTVLPYFFIADGAYALMPNVMKPYKSNNMSCLQQSFNRKLSAARSVVERAFGQMAKKFTIFNKTIEQSPETVNDIVKCACLLHNITMHQSAEPSWEQHASPMTSGADEADDAEVNDDLEMNGEGGRVRDLLANYLENGQS